MPACSNPTKWRSTPTAVKLGMMLLNPATILSGQVNQSVFSYPLLQFTYDNGSGSFASTHTGMMILLGTTPGADDLGRTVIHDPASNNTVYVAPASQGTRDGELALADDVYFTILNFYPPFAKIPRVLDTTEYKWYNIVLQALQPKANSGGGYADWPDPSTGLITVNFNGAASYDLANGSLTHAWDFADGTPSAAATATVTGVTFPKGFRYVRHTVTAGSENHTMVIPVYNPGTDDNLDSMYIQNFAITSHHAEPKGQELSVRIDQDIPMTSFPDGTLCMIWSRTYWGDGSTGQVNVSLGPPGREHMIFCGWHHVDPSMQEGRKAGIYKETTFNLLDIAGKLRTLPAFTQLLERATTAANWHQMVNLQVNREYLDYLLRWHSNALELADFNPYGISYPISTLGSDGMSLYDQTDQRAQAMACNLTCDREGSLWVIPDPQLLATADQVAQALPSVIPQRTSTVIIALQTSDYTRVKYTRTRPPRYHWLRGNTILTSTTPAASVVNVPLAFVIAPGPVPGQGLDEADHGEQVALNLAELQFREGNRYAAMLNNFEGSYEIPLVPPGDAGIDPAYGQWVQLTVDSNDDSYRDLAFTNALMYVSNIEITYDHANLNRLYTLTADRNTVGYQAPEDPQPANTLPTYDTPVEQPIPPVTRTDDIPATHTGGTVLAMDSSHLGYTTEWLSGSSPHWNPLSQTGLSGTLYDLVLDPASQFLGPTQAGNLGAWCLTSVGLFYTTNILNLSSTWTQTYTPSPTPTYGVLRAPIWNTGGIYLSWVHESSPGATNSQVYVARLSNYGSTTVWTQTLGTAHNNGANLGFDIDQYGTDEMLCNAWDNGAAHNLIYRIINGSISASISTPTNVRLIPFIQKPLYTFGGAANNTTGGSENFIITTVDTDNTTARVFKTSNGGSSFTNITPSGGAAANWLASSICFTTDANRIAISSYNASTIKLWTSTNGGTSWTDNGGSSSYLQYASGYFPRLLSGDYGLYLGGPTDMAFSPDFGVTKVVKTGDWTTAIGAVTNWFAAVIPLY